MHERFHGVALKSLVIVAVWKSEVIVSGYETVQRFVSLSVHTTVRVISGLVYTFTSRNSTSIPVCLSNWIFWFSVQVRVGS